MPIFIPEPKHHEDFPKRKKIIILKLARKYKSIIILLIGLFAIIICITSILLKSDFIVITLNNRLAQQANIKNMLDYF